MELDQLEKLNNLKEKGLLTEIEFQNAKDKILNSINNDPIYNNIKKCKYCNKHIPINSKVCPHCAKNSNKDNPLLVLLAMLFIFISIFVFFSTDPPSTYSKNSIISSKMLYISDSYGYSDEFIYHIDGNIKNNTNDTYSYVQVFFNLYDKNGNQIGTAKDNVKVLKPKSTWHFNAISFDFIGNEVASFKLSEISAIK